MGSLCSNANVPHTSNEKNFNVFDLDASNTAQHVECMIIAAAALDLLR